ncbi:hypothetical protein GGS21DRAFT_159346 [Xylaria nigripes]|nr:hypothetical protein GGS21DRAFT_159346 [Xylaria nigripes]
MGPSNKHFDLRRNAEMARRKVVADSEDEDDGEDELASYTEGGFARPEPEQLSPHHQPSSPVAPEGYKQPSSVTTSFFTDIYTNQQTLAVQESNLIENIVRQCQMASASSGNISLPPIKQGGKESFGTDVTTPLTLSRAQKNRALVSDGGSEITTPCKSRGQEWEVPSSAEDANGREKTNAEGKRSISGLASSFFIASSSTKALTEDRTAPVETPAAKRAKLSHHTPALSGTPNFYIAPSSLTTMEKLQYQKVNMCMNEYGMLPGLPSNNKSSYTASIPHSTKSGYTSNLPQQWEESPPPACPPQNNVITISSSPDVITSGFDSPNGRQHVVDSETEIPVPNKHLDSRSRPQHRTPESKEKETVAKGLEEDELCRETAWDSNDFNLPRELYKPRPTKRRAAAAAAAAARFSKADSDTDAFEDASEEVVVQKVGVSKLPAPDLRDIDPLELPAEAPPKKPGRKNKHNVIETSDTETAEGSYLEHYDVPLSDESDAGPVIVRPKKKRGVARKESSTAREPQRPHSPQQKDDLDRPDVIIKERVKANGKKNGTIEKIADKGTESKKNRLLIPEANSYAKKVPPKDADGDLATPCVAVSTTKPPTKAEETKDEKLVAKTQSKELTRPAATPSKATYRVGLSKRSRIAPLLKTIRK